MLTRISRRNLKKEAGSDVDQGNESESSTTIAIARTSKRVPEGKCGLGKKSKSRADDEANSSMPTYSFADYCAPSPAVVYTRSEDEANKLVQTLERYACRLSYCKGSASILIIHR